MREINSNISILVHRSLLLIIAFSFFFSCKDDKPSEEDLFKLDLFAYMQSWYLWNDKLPESIDPSSYADANEMVQSVKYSELDKWSAVYDISVADFLQDGEYSGFGISLKWDNDARLKVASVYEGSEAYIAGVKRGWEIITIDNLSLNNPRVFNVFNNAVVGSSVNFRFKSQEGEFIDLDIEYLPIVINAVDADTVFNISGKQIGYFSYSNFVMSSDKELDEVFKSFKEQNVSDLIIDLRYNGGGSVLVAYQLMLSILPAEFHSQVAMSYVFNKSKSMYNETYTFDQIIEESRDTTLYWNESFPILGIDRIVFIVSEMSASASELLINILKPYMNITVIGSDKTYGKPVGSRGMVIDNYFVSIIDFKILNGDGVGNYFGGLQYDIYAEDKIIYEFGDPNENMLKTAIDYLESGVIAKQEKPVLKSYIKQKNSQLYPDNSIQYAY